MRWVAEITRDTENSGQIIFEVGLIVYSGRKTGGDMFKAVGD